MSGSIYDSIVVGGGPAGLTGALVLGRCRRSTLVFDTGAQRNKVSRAMHAFPSRDGEHPGIFINTVRKELRKYGIVVKKKEIVKVAKRDGIFRVTSSSGEQFQSRTLLLATGIVDTLPPIPGVVKFYGRGVYHCAYCDGWENRDKPWALCASSGKAAVAVARKLRNWTGDLTVLSSYSKGFSKSHHDELLRLGAKVLKGKVVKIEGAKGRLSSMTLDDRTKVRCHALFFSSPARQHSNLAAQMNCRFTRGGHVNFDRFQQTNVEGLFVAGDMARDMQLMLIAAAEGARAGVMINEQLLKAGLAL
jgi:thioredoxin reductase